MHPPRMYSLQICSSCCASAISCLPSTTSNGMLNRIVLNFSTASANFPPVVNW